MIKIGNAVAVLMLLGSVAFASSAFAATTVQSTVNRNEMGIGDNVQVTVSVNSEDDVDIQEPRIPELDGFDLLNTSQSTAVSQKLVQTAQGMQFQTQRKKDFVYILQAKRTGTLSISSFEVVVDGKVHRTQPIVIKVNLEPQGNGQQNAGRGANPGFDDPFESMDRAEEDIFNQLLQQRQKMLQQMNRGWDPQLPQQQQAQTQLPEVAFRSLPTNPNEAFYISVEVDKTEVYEGEQVTVNWYIYTRGQMETLDRLKFPNLRGFWKEIIEEVPSIQFTEEIVNGLPWKKALLASHALFPIKAGTAEIDEYKIKSRVRTPSQAFGGFYGKAYEYTKSSVPVEIKVKELPLEGRPKEFTGAVGKFEVMANVENKNVLVNQPVSLKVRFEGAGNAKIIDLPAMNLPGSLEMYDSKSESKFFKNGRSFKEFEVLLIPREVGEVQIPKLTVGLFDPKTASYYLKETDPITLNVVANPNAVSGESHRLADSKKSEPAPEVLALPNPVTNWSEGAFAQHMANPYLWMGVYLLGLLGLLRKAQKEFGWGRKKKSVKEVVDQRFKSIDEAAQKSDFRKVGVEMTNLYYLVLGEVAGEGGASEELTRLMSKIPPSLRRDHGAEIEKSFELFQTMGFAPEEMLGSLRQSQTITAHVKDAKVICNSVLSYLQSK